MNHSLLNPYNYISLFRVLIIFKNPFYFLFCIIFHKIPQKIEVHTPIGLICIYLRNYESLKTVFSIFCREDYIVDSSNNHFLDLGSNCGYSALYFLSRNNKNTIDCYEPEKENIKFLKKNLSIFEGRYNIFNAAVSISNKKELFYTSADGKYSSLLKNKTSLSYEVNVLSLISILDGLKNKNKIILKIDIEGLEEKIIKNTNFDNYKNISKLIIESKNCSNLIKKKHTRVLINGYIEHISFYETTDKN